MVIKNASYPENITEIPWRNNKERELWKLQHNGAYRGQDSYVKAANPIYKLVEMEDRTWEWILSKGEIVIGSCGELETSMSWKFTPKRSQWRY